MSNYHILECDRHDKAKVIFHIPVPNEDNVVGVNLQTALKQYLESGSEAGVITSGVPWITTELASLQDGSVYEHIEIVEYDGSLTNAQKQSLVDARYTALLGSVPDKIRNRLKFWGLDRDVV